MNRIKLTTTRLFSVALLLCGLMTIQTPAAPGDLDPSFGNGGIVSSPYSSGNNFRASAAAIQSDGKIVVAGNTNITSGIRFTLARYQARTESSLTVTRSDDRNNPTCASSDCSLREAVNAANASPTDDMINFASGLATITLTDEIIINNAGALAINGTGANILTIDGGAGTNRIFSANQATVAISGMTLTGGNGTGAMNSNTGGAIYANGGSLTFDSVHVTGNEAISFPGGGGAYFDGGTHRIINSTFSANTASDCAGFATWIGSTVTVVNSTISGNTARGGGGSGGLGGGFCTESGNTVLRNVTITNNTATRAGGGIFLEGNYTFNFSNTILAGNSASLGPEIYFEEATITSGGYNLVVDAADTGFMSAINYQPTDLLFVNPLLGALQNNGGTTPTHALLAGSPAIDKGLSSLAVDPFNNSILQTDQRGLARIIGSAVDIGAFEFASKSRKRIRFTF